jgi:hypothetical protein
MFYVTQFPYLVFPKVMLKLVKTYRIHTNMIRTVCVSFAVSLVNSEHSADDSKKLIRFHSERIP